MAGPLFGRVIFGTCVATLLFLSPSRAEMLQFSRPDGIKSWPKLPDISERHQDQELSIKQGANFLVPDGADPATSDVSIQARGYPRGDDTAGLSQLMDKDREELPPGTQVTKHPELYDKDSIVFEVITYSPASGQPGDWKAVAYSQEGQYLLTFTLDARSKAAFDKNFSVLTSLVQKYAEDIPW